MIDFVVLWQVPGEKERCVENKRKEGEKKETRLKFVSYILETEPQGSEQGEEK